LRSSPSITTEFEEDRCITKNTGLVAAGLLAVSTMMFFQKKKEEDEQEDKVFQHNIEKGDHLIRWTNMLIWPVQVHAICISSSDGCVTLVDFGLAASKKAKSNDENESQENATEFEDFMDEEDRMLANAAEQHRSEIVGPDRINILTLTKEEEIRQWRKVQYGKELEKSGFWNWWKKKDDEEEESKPEEKNTNSDEEKSVKAGVDQSSVLIEQQKDANDSNTEEEIEDRKEIPELVAPNTEDEIEAACEIQSRNFCTPWKWGNDVPEVKETESESDASATEASKKSTPPSLPDSDPTNIVLARVRYLLTNPQVLPPHNVFYSNSECIGVWCKTGRWSTIQASILLHSTAAGNLKSAITVASVAASATVTTTTTAPAWGVLGWMGMTTTTTSTVGFLSLHPWVIPAIAGYGVVAVGAPIVLLQQAKKRWAEITQTLTDGFWEWADKDVYVEAIQSWSGVV